MPWMVTADGHEISLQYPQRESFHIEHIAHALAQINRFTGHAARPYSVAEHSLLVCDIAERHFGLSIHGQFAALMHDAHEAYTSDLSTPAKKQVGSGWADFEGHFGHLVASRFNFKTALSTYHKQIVAADRLALATERHQLMPSRQPNGYASTPWPGLAGIEPLADFELMHKDRCAMHWSEWRDAFIDKFQELQFARAELTALNPVEQL